MAALAEPVSIAVRTLNRAQVGEGEQVVVIGAGPIGQAVAPGRARNAAATCCSWTGCATASSSARGSA